MQTIVSAFFAVHLLFICQPLFARTCKEVAQGFVFRELNQNEMQIFTRFAFESNAMRSESDGIAWLQYKNGSNEKPQTVNLSDFKLNSSWPVGFKESPQKLPNFPLQYEAAVLALKKGDSVQFGSKIFKLGEFLGSGNASHIFALADQPDTVIKIPFLAARIANANTLRGLETIVEWRESHYDRMLEVNKKSYLALAKERNDISTDDNFRYILMPRIRGTMLGSDFLKILSPILRGRGLYIGEAFYIDLKALPDSIDLATKGHLLELINWMHLRGHAPVLSHGSGSVYILNTEVSRQLMLSDQGKWEVLDAE